MKLLEINAITSALNNKTIAINGAKGIWGITIMAKSQLFFPAR